MKIKFKKLLSVVLSVVIIACAMPLGAFEFKASAATSDGENLFENGDFASYSGYTPTNWYVGLNNSTAEIVEDTELPDGTKINALKYTHTDGGNKGNRLNYIKNIKIEKNTSYTMTFWVKMKNSIGFSAFMYEPDYIDKNGELKHSNYAADGENIYSYRYDNNTRVIRTEIEHKWVVAETGKVIDSAGPSTFQTRSKGKYLVLTPDYPEQNRQDEWVQVVHTFTTGDNDAHEAEILYEFKTFSAVEGEVWFADFEMNAVKIVSADVSVVGDGTATVSENSLASGSDITFTALPYYKAEFLGWYNGEEKVSDDLIYTFTITEDTFLTAKFTTNVAEPEEPEPEEPNPEEPNPEEPNPEEPNPEEPEVMTGFSGECIWILHDTSLTIRGGGRMGDYTEETLPPWGTEITEVVIEEGVTSIGDLAFCGCVNLTSVTIPDSVTEIGYGAFAVSAITEITIPDNVTSIADYTFLYCPLLKSVTIGKSVTSIGNDVFTDCTNLEYINITNLAAWCEMDFSTTSYPPLYYAKNLYINGTPATDIVIPNGVTSIGDLAFFGCVNLTSVTIPDSVTSIGLGAFANCDSLEYVNISDIAAWCNICFEEYNYNPLYYAGNLYINGTLATDIIIPDSITKIPSYAFYGCTSLKSVTIPTSVTHIGYKAFYGSVDYVYYLGSEKDAEGIHFSGATWFYNSCIGTSEHTYTDECDEICNICDFVRMPPHIYDNGCDEICNICGHTKSPLHIYENECDEICNVCGHTRIPPHIYDNACDTICNECDFVREITEHVYENDCDTTCNECGFVREVSDHVYGEWFITTPPTCFAEGIQTRVCICGASETVKLEIVPHEYSSKINEPTCTEQGYTLYTCISCGESYKDNYTSALGHSYGEWVITTPPTCLVDGTQKRVCSCGAIETINLGSVPHEYSSKINEPTCTAQGYTLYTCNICGVSYKDNYVSSLGHSYGDWKISTNATCTTNGLKYRECSVCGNVTTTTIYASGHSYSNKWTTDVPATCTTNGSKSRHCVNCDAKTDVTVIPAYGHAFDSWKYESVPTCTVAGKIVCSCLLCGEQKTITVEPYGHDFSSEWTVDTEPNCTEVGIKSNHCSRCDEVDNETEIPALGHDYTSVIIAPTCTEQGYTEHTCTACGDFYRTNVVEANGHSLTHYDAKNATCTTSGHNAYDECSVCGFTTYKEINPTGHNYQPNGSGYACTYCGAVISGGESENHNYVKTIVKATAEQNGYTQYTCTDCGYYYRTEETEYINGPKFSISDSIVGAGKKFIVTVSISENPGIYSFTLNVDYDMDNLTLKEVKKLGELGGDFSHHQNKILWLNNTRENSTYNGEFCQLVFETSTNTVAQDYSISVTYGEGEVVNFGLNDVNLAVENGVVTVEAFTAGDLNGDGKVNNKDLVLMSEIFARNYTVYSQGKEHNDKNKIKNFNVFGKTAMNDLKNYDMVALGVIVSRVALDCNNDGVINNHDLLTMMKYLRGEEITIH